MAIIRTTRYHIEITNIDKNGNLNIVYPKNTVDDVYMDPKKKVTIKGKVFFYGATAIDSDVQTIDVTVPGFQLVQGAHVTVLFEKGIKSSNPKLRINNGITTLSPVPIFYRNAALPPDLIKAQAVVDLVYSIGNFHVSHEFISEPLSLDNGRKIFLTGVDPDNAKLYPDKKFYDNQVYIDTTAGRLVASTFLGTTYYFENTNSYINKSDYTGNSATTTKFKTARNIKVGKKNNSFDGTSDIEFTLAQIDAVAKDGDTMRGNLKITSESPDSRFVTYKGNGIQFTLPTGNGGFAGGISYVKPEDNTVEGCFGLYRGQYFYFGSSYDNPNGTVKAAHFVGHLQGTSDIASKLTTSTVGNNTKFFYLNAGVATASTATIGSGIKPMFLNSGTFTASSSTIGSGVKPVYLSSGTITASASNVGSVTNPVYMNAGTISASNANVGSANVPVYMSGGVITSTGKSFVDYLTRAGGTMTGAISMSVGATDYTGTPVTQISGTMGANDSWKIASGATANDAGFVEFQTHDNGNEPIYFAQYSSGTRVRRLTLLDGSGNSNFPGTIITPNISMSGRLTGGKLSLPTTGGSWISGMTLSNPSIQISTQNSSGSYHPIIGGKTYNNHIWNLGTYVNEIGFYGFKSGRTANGTDWSFIINSASGEVTSSHKIIAPTFQGTATAVSGISGHIRDNLTGNGVVDKALSANQGYQLKTSLDNHTHGLLHTNFLTTLANTATDSGWSMICNPYNGGILKALRTQGSAPAWTIGNYSAGVAFGGSDTKGVLTCAYNAPSIKFAGGNGSKPVWWIGMTGTSGTTYDMNKINAAMPASYFHWSGQTGQPTWLWGGNAQNDYYVWNPSNFSVANAAKCANLAPSHAVGANTIVTRQGNGYTFLNYINSNTAYNENPAIGNFIVVNSSDGAYYRKASIAHVKSALKVPTFSLSGTTLTITLA